MNAEKGRTGAGASGGRGLAQYEDQVRAAGGVEAHGNGTPRDDADLAAATGMGFSTKIGWLNAQVQELRAQRLRASATSVHNDQFSEVMSRHPIVEIGTVGNSTAGAAGVSAGKRALTIAKAKKHKHISMLESSATVALPQLLRAVT